MILFNQAYIVIMSFFIVSSLGPSSRTYYVLIVTGYEDKENVHSIVTMDPVKVRNHYLRGWFAVDFISTFPADDFILPFIRPDTGEPSDL